jgi:hypothetical protein
MKKTAIYVFTFFSLTTLSFVANADDDCATNPDHPCAEFGCPQACLDDPNGYEPLDVPIDGGVSLIVLGGAALGIFGSKKKKKAL